jgi:hypothetical protein
MGAPSVALLRTRFEHLRVQYWQIALEYRERQYTGGASILVRAARWRQYYLLV